MNDKTYCFFGDSVTQGAYVQNTWVELLQHFLEEKYQDDFVNVFNLGIGGNTSKDVLKRFDNECSSRYPTHIIFAVGINDSAYLLSSSKSIVEERQFVMTLKELIVRAHIFSQDIIFLGLALGDDTGLQPFPGSSRGKSFTHHRMDAYDKIIKDVAEENGCTYIHIQDKLLPDDFLDGLHPNAEGHKKIFEIIKEWL